MITFENKAVDTFMKIGFGVFIGLSLLNLYYSIKVNRKMLKNLENV
jgi:hypothetical protein